MSVFKTIRYETDMISVAERYCISVKRNKFINCIFHNDKHPSMKLYKERYHCNIPSSNGRRVRGFRGIYVKYIPNIIERV